MARVIKGNKQNRAKAAPLRIRNKGGKKIIAREVFQAQQKAAEMIQAAEKRKEEILLKGQNQAHIIREEARIDGAKEAFAHAAAEAIQAFKRRGDQLNNAGEDIRFLSLSICEKILGLQPSLSELVIKKVVDEEMQGLRARRKLRLLLSSSKEQQIKRERRNLCRAIDAKPDFEIQYVDDVNDGFARVVTEVSAALCVEDDALNTLAEIFKIEELHDPGNPIRSYQAIAEEIDSDESTVIISNPESSEALDSAVQEIASEFEIPRSAEQKEEGIQQAQDSIHSRMMLKSFDVESFELESSEQPTGEGAPIQSISNFEFSSEELSAENILPQPKQRSSKHRRTGLTLDLSDLDSEEQSRESF